MLNYNLQILAEITHSKLLGADVKFSAISTDSKNIAAHALFIPIKGERFDGHEFIEEAIAKGAVAFISEKEIFQPKTSYVLVNNTRIALGKLAAFQRRQFKNPVIGLTGSMGKTTTKAMIAAILKQHNNVLSPESSMNNDIGLPLTLLQLDKQDYAVIEMGTNHPGEIAYLAEIAKPDIALITNIGAAHLEAFKTLENVAKEKATIFRGLSEKGVAVVNQDDPQTANLLHEIHDKKIISFGIAKNADVRAEQIKLNSLGQASFTLMTKAFEAEIQLQCYGEHNVKNALAAAAVASVLNIPFADIKAGLETFSPVSKRLQRCMGLNGSVILDDSYSAIPDAVIAALKVLACATGEKIFIFGGMAELNPDKKIDTHRQIGALAKQLGINQLFTLGEMAEHAAAAFGNTAKHFVDKSELIAFAKTLLKSNVTVLIKGSRGMRMEEVVKSLVEETVKN